MHPIVFIISIITKVDEKFINIFKIMLWIKINLKLFKIFPIPIMLNSLHWLKIIAIRIILYCI